MDDDSDDDLDDDLKEIMGDDLCDNDNNNKKKSLEPFWNDDVQFISDRIFIPSFDNIRPIDNSSTLSGSWFNSKTHVGNDLNDKYTDINCSKRMRRVCEKNGKSEYYQNKCKKIKILLTAYQKRYIKIMIGTYRYFYNLCVNFIKNYNKETKTSTITIQNNYSFKSEVVINVDGNPYNFINARKHLKKKAYYPIWLMKGYPSHLIDKAIKECIDNYLTCLDKYKKYRIVFDIKFKTCKNKIQTMNLECDMVTKKYNGLFSKLRDECGNYIFRNLRTSEKLKKYDFGDSSISYNKITHETYLNLSCKMKVNNKPKKYDICSIDPGVRTFLTIYDGTKVTEIGHNNSKIYKTCREIDIIHSRVDSKKYIVKENKNGSEIEKEYKVNAKRRYKLKKALHRKIEYLKNLKKEMHKKAAKYLCDNYQTIILPPFETQNMASKLNSKIARQMYTLSHYSFREYLINKAAGMMIDVYVEGEEYTTKTCGRCGELNDVGDSKNYSCKSCGIKIDRDMNASRNIMLRNIIQIYNERKLHPVFIKSRKVKHSLYECFSNK